ncbi:FAD binding oxidoreductase, putative [Talaromyces stipitatus ATCC 10500]|uniref:FAD binding oxidoreductase, putative n=1 Tax=Talaromyces stipitatus (strain ATCC 10500 / CBS 375.48 / QM 6759 / NRRL 1006) TaxID=441959 RepID=B8LV11_TALSN|nr:FAD binding oxidoreductase, putative [Talaromyces stipitatus ATCC 10500]EED22632.1 FAD binding oxidoreductase, putative [Talaromyces stipitatus ATCC 10500]
MSNMYLLAYSRRSTKPDQPLSIIWRGQVNESVYEEARVKRIFNCQRPTRYPQAIIFAKTESDIINAVNLAIDQKYSISIRAGGHSWPVWSLRDDTILMDLGCLSDISLDEETGVVRVSPSTTGKELSDYLHAKGRTFPVGHCPDVGLGGYLLCGGMGWNSNNWGWACEYVVAVDVVTSTGEIVHADVEQNNDLFWATRGSGPGFPGIVTRFHLQSRLLPKIMKSSLYIYTMKHYQPVFDWALKIPSGIDEGLEIAVIGSYPPEFNEPCITVALLALGDSDESVIKVLRRADESHPDGAVTRSFCGNTSFNEQFRHKAKVYPEKHRYCADNSFLHNDVDVPSILEKAFSTLPTRKSLVLYNSLIPTSRRDLPPMALSVQSDHYFALYGIWEDAKDDVHNQAWVSNIMEEVGRHSTGAYIGEFDFLKRQSRLWGFQEKEKLKAIRQKWDPNGVFCSYLGLELGL